MAKIIFGPFLNHPVAPFSVAFNRIAKLTNSTLVVDLIPNEPNQSEQMDLEIEKDKQ